MATKLSRETRLKIIIGISACFFITEIAVGFYTKSIALIADAFHYLNDLIGLIVALVALKMSQRSEHPKDLAFGFQRAQLLGAFFNSVFLFALGTSIFLQSIDRFISLQKVQNPKLVVTIGGVGLGLNLMSAAFIHEHDHTPVAHSLSEMEGQIEPGAAIETTPLHPDHRHNLKAPLAGGRDFGMMGVFLHILGDAANNVGVIIAGLVIWQAKYEGRYYADPATSMGISILIMGTAIPLVKKTGTVLMGSVPLGVNVADIQHDIEKISGVISVHELHVWRLNQQKSIASAHVCVSETSTAGFLKLAKTIQECLHAYGIHSATIQPEVKHESGGFSQGLESALHTGQDCNMTCGPSCDSLACCS